MTSQTVNSQLFASAVILSLIFAGFLAAENIDPANDDSQYAWGENVGWINFEPLGDGGSGVEVTDTDLTGFFWGENVGWISLSCENTASCATVDYGVINDGAGNLAGFAWGENIGWISFSCANTASCATADYGVTIDPITGIFQGYAWAENVGWINFFSSGAVPFQIRTSWNCPSTGTPPSEVPVLLVEKNGSNDRLYWQDVTGAAGYDLVRGDLNTLLASGGDFSASVIECMEDNTLMKEASHTGIPAAGEGYWFVLRGVNCWGDGSYDTGGSQSGLRDAEITSSGSDCS